MVDWTKSMAQSFEYAIVDPNTWKDYKLLDTVRSSTISRDSSAETLGSASINLDGLIGECYVRIYLVTIQNGVKERHALGTFLVQTPSSTFDGKVKAVTVETYTPLLELKEGYPPIGYYTPKGENIMSTAYRLVRENVRAPVVQTDCTETVFQDFVAETSDTWLSYISDLISNAKYSLELDEMGRILFSPTQSLASLQPVWTYSDDNSSILSPSISMDHDLYGIPNVVEVIYSSGSINYTSRVVNDDPNSPVSTIARGREIPHRVTDPELVGTPTEEQIDEYAKKLLENLSSLEYTVTYTHGYCPVRVGDCVRLNYKRADLVNVKAKVISQTIKCEAGCQVTEKAVYTKRLWG